MAILMFKQLSYTDREVVKGLQNRDRKVEDWFYKATRRYYYDHFNEIFFDQDRKQEIFQSAFLKLWTEIANGKISLLDDCICRQQQDGTFKPMNCSLTTFFMAFAKNENREILRHTKDVYVEQLFEDERNCEVAEIFNNEEEVATLKERIVDDCIQSMSPHCVEILTLFYYEQRTLDEILVIRKEKSATKTGLKSAKAKCMATLRKKVTDEMNRWNICC